MGRVLTFHHSQPARPVPTLCSKLCSRRVGKRQIGTGQDRIAIRRISAGNREIWRDSRGVDGTLVGLANRRLRPLGHLTIDGSAGSPAPRLAHCAPLALRSSLRSVRGLSSIRDTGIYTEALDRARQKAVRFQTAAFEAKCNSRSTLWRRHAARLGTPFWAHYWAHTLCSFVSSLRKRNGNEERRRVFEPSPLWLHLQPSSRFRSMRSD